MPLTNGLDAADTPPSPTRISSINAYLANHGYQLGKVIGEGSYSKVRLCHCQPTQPSSTSTSSLPSSIACKVINKRKASGDFVHKFLPRELQIVNRLRHPSIVTVFDVVECDQDQNVYIFMDLCSNGDLLEFVKHKGHLSERRAQNYFRQILCGVRYLHALDLAHRDLKCENILLTKNDTVKLSDFGFSRYCRDSTTGKRSLSNTYCGSAAYAAPEILQGTMYNPKLYDMWSLGCILFIMLTGYMPFDESNIQKMLQNQLSRVLSYPQQVQGLISAPAKRLIRHLLEPDVTRRANIEQALANPWFSSFDSTATRRVDAPGPDDVKTESGEGDHKTEDSRMVDVKLNVIEVKLEDPSCSKEVKGPASMPLTSRPLPTNPAKDIGQARPGTHRSPDKYHFDLGELEKSIKQPENKIGGLNTRHFNRRTPLTATNVPLDQASSSQREASSHGIIGRSRPTAANLSNKVSGGLRRQPKRK